MDVGLVNFLFRVTDATSGSTVVDSDDQVYTAFTACYNNYCLSSF